MKHFFVGFVVLPIVALACAGSSGDGDGDGNAALSGFIADYCDAFMPCCAEAGLPADGARCRALFGEAFGADDFEFDEAAADECLSCSLVNRDAAWLRASGLVASIQQRSRSSSRSPHLEQGAAPLRSSMTTPITEISWKRPD
jgi:hypothetical protein